MTERILRAFHVPADERIVTGVYTEQFDHLKQRAGGIEFPKIVKTQYLHDNGCVMVVDEDGHKKGLAVNRRAQFLSGYPLDHAIRGDALFFSLQEDPMNGAYLTDVSDRTLERYLQNKEVHQGFSPWLFSEPVARFSAQHGLFFYRRQPRKQGCPGHAPAGGYGSEEPSEPDFCDGACAKDF